MSKSLRKLVYPLASIAVIGMLTLACQSKNSEKTPDIGDDGKSALANRLQKKSAADELIDEALRHVDLLKRVLDLYRQTQTTGAVEYTPLDFFTDVSKELKKPLPRKLRGTYVSETTLNLSTISAVPEDCRTIDARMTSDHSVQQAKDKTIHDKVQMRVSLRTCSTDGAFVPAFKFVREKGIGTLQIDYKSLRKVFAKMLKPVQVKDANCAIELGAQDRTESISCANMIMSLGPNRNALIESLVLSPEQTAEPVKLSAIVFENEVAKVRVVGSIKPGAAPNLKFESIDSVRPPQAAQNGTDGPPQK